MLAGELTTNPGGTAASHTATLSMIPSLARGALTLLTYNVKGNGVTDWSVDTPQVQAIGRQLAFLKPDIITLNEIPFRETHRMADFVAVYLPSYALATNSGTDGFIRSVILSRFPIRRSQKWLDGESLAAFGFKGQFTRDLFEAEIDVPDFQQPLQIHIVG
jgi:endonuclease/exonuclease/phosphatase family metal-dependent hydrolase